MCVLSVANNPPRRGALTFLPANGAAEKSRARFVARATSAERSEARPQTSVRATRYTMHARKIIRRRYRHYARRDVAIIGAERMVIALLNASVFFAGSSSRVIAYRARYTRVAEIAMRDSPGEFAVPRAELENAWFRGHLLACARRFFSTT